MNREKSVIGLGYVCLRVALAICKKSKVIGFDINGMSITELRNGKDNKCEVELVGLSEADINFSSNLLL